LRDGGSIQFLGQFRDRQNETPDANVVQLSHRDSGQAESENRRRHRSGKTQEFAPAPTRRFDRSGDRARSVPSNAHYFWPEQNGYESKRDQRKQAQPDEMPDEYC